jgi:hypothetical protein
LALLFTSSEVTEIIGLCDRTLAFYKGKVLQEPASRNHQGGRHAGDRQRRSGEDGAVTAEQSAD